MTNLKMFLIASTVILFTACGGGGGGSSGGDTGSSQRTMVTITDQNADRVIAAASQSMKGAMQINNRLGLNSASVVSQGIAKINKVGNIASSDKTVAPLAESGNETCSGGGTVTYDFNDNGGYYNFNNCIENDIGLTLDGKITMEKNGNAYNVVYSDFTLESHYDDWSVYYQNATVNLNTSTYDMSGTLTGYISTNGDKVEFDQYNFSKTGDSLTYNGFVKTSCLTGWIELKTTRALQMSNYGYGCPTAGELVAIGNNTELKTVFNADKSVTVYLNDEILETYSDCNVLPSACDGSKDPVYVDEIIDSFTFTNVSDADFNIDYESNLITISGINISVDVYTDNGIIIKNNVDLNTDTTTVVAGDTIKIKLLSSSELDTTVTASVTIGTLTETYSITTMDTLFKDVNVATESTYYTSNQYSVPNNGTSVSIDSGILIKNGIEIGTLNTIANSGDSIQIKLLSGANFGDIVTSNINIDGVHDTFSVTTKPEDYDFISNGSYAPSDTTFYYLTMPSNGNLDIDFSSTYTHSVTIYDMDMNVIHSTIHGNRTVSLNTGSYIVKMAGGSSAYPVTFYTPVFDTEHKFESLSNGSYAPSDTTFYYLTMPSNGNLDIDFSSTYTHSVTIYDMDMNAIHSTIHGNRTVSLNTGSYIVKMAGGSSAYPVTFYTPVFDTEHKFESLSNGSYAPSDTTFYYLTMPSNGNLDIDFSSTYTHSVTIYDMDMNVIHSTIHGNRTVSLNTGSYIVKMAGGSSAYPVTFYTPVFDTEHKFESLSNGSYAPSDTTFYYLTMPSNGNLDIDFSSTYTHSVTIYDMDMNVIHSTIHGNRTVSLNTGSYIVKMAGGSSAYPITFYSPQLN